MRNALTILVAITAIALALPAAPANVNRAGLPKVPVLGSKLTSPMMSPDMIKELQAAQAAAPKRSTPLLAKKGGNPSNPALSAGALDFGCFDKDEYRSGATPLTSTTDLTEEWMSYPSNAYSPWFGSPVEANGIYVFQNMGDGYLYGLNVADGTPAWPPYQVFASYYYSGQPTIYKNQVIIYTLGTSGSTPTLWDFDLNTGALNWKKSETGYNTNILIQFARPTLMPYNGTDYIWYSVYDLSGGTDIEGFRCSDGTQDYYQTISGYYCYAGMSKDASGDLFVSTDYGGVYSFTPNATGPGLTQNWEQSPTPSSALHACPVWDQATNCIYTQCGEITGPSYAYCLDAKTGVQKWISEIGDGTSGQDLQCATVDANNVYANAGDFYYYPYYSQVQAFNKATGASVWSPAYYQTNDADLTDFSAIITTGTTGGNHEKLYIPTAFGSTYSGHIRVLDAGTGALLQDYGAYDYFYNFGCRIANNYFCLTYFGDCYNFSTTDILPTIHDVGVTDLIAPVGRIDSGTVVVPACSTYNFGTVTEGPYPVQMTYTGFPPQVVTTAGGQLPGTKAYVAGTGVTLTQRGGPFTIDDTTQLDGDANIYNDAMTGTFYVDVHDLGVDSLSPYGSGEPGSYIPIGYIFNHGTRREACTAEFKISNSPHADWVLSFPNGLPVGVETTLVFNQYGWYIGNGSWTCTCQIGLADDQILANNSLTEPLNIGTVEVDLGTILTPTGMSNDTGTPITPSVTVTNHSSFAVTFPCEFYFDSVGATTPSYDRTITVTGLGIGETRTLVFPLWIKPYAIQTYASTCTAAVAGANVLHGTFATVARQPVMGWSPLQPLPPGTKGKNIKDGGALAYAQAMPTLDGGDTNYVYAFKGNGLYEFYRYNATSGAWISRDSIPAVGKSNKKKAVKKGSALAYAGDEKVYATKGNNTLEFWQYDPSKPAGATWSEMANEVPAGGKNCKEGVSMAAATIGGANYIYFLKGSGTFEFYRYNVDTQTWVTLTNAPTGGGKAYKIGSSIAYNGGDTIYCMKAGVNEFYAYSITNNNWVTLETLPKIVPGAKKKLKVGDGAQLAYTHGMVYTLKGNNSNEFWTFQCDSNRWVHGTDITTGTKKVKGGGALVAAGNGNLYAFRGNNTLEFWLYGVGSFDALAGKSELKGVMGATQVRATEFALRISPNPFTGMSQISYSLPRAGNVSLKLYDVTGNLVKTLVQGYTTMGSHTAGFSAGTLARGIYLLKYVSDGNTTTSKLILE